MIISSGSIRETYARSGQGTSHARPRGGLAGEFDLLESAQTAVQMLAGSASRRSQEGLELAVVAALPALSGRPNLVRYGLP